MPRLSKYPEQFRRDTVELVRSSPHRSLREIGREFGVNHETLRGWVNAVRNAQHGVRLHAGIGYVTPDDEHEGRGKEIRKAREAGLEAARGRRLAYHRQHHHKTKREPGDVV